ncbi:DUF4328 domain-containing protein [Erythrobacter colymbi]|uniref:DUF4328 domain-containing protein n=1 Tax=Erythrobacter colymbi TaxID=1161202 RepID=UPI001F0A5872|nr:DUF4328 domain-containing protein [Erythrobacter colymbi]
MQEEGVVAGIGVLRQREKIAVFAMYATMAIFALTAVGEVLELAGVIDLTYGAEEPLAMIYAVILLVNFVIYIGSVIAVAMWIYRAHANLHAAALPGLEFTLGWAVGWYFIPIAFLFKPYQAMKELWRESFQTGDSYSAPPPATLSGWWGFWIVGVLAGNISTRVSLMGDGANVQVALVIGLVSSVAMVGSAWLLMRIIREVTAAQANGFVAAQIFE